MQIRASPGTPGRYTQGSAPLAHKHGCQLTTVTALIWEMTHRQQARRSGWGGGEIMPPLPTGVQHHTCIAPSSATSSLRASRAKLVASAYSCREMNSFAIVALSIGGPGCLMIALASATAP